MLIRTRHFSIVGLPWTGIRSFARAFVACAPDAWELRILPTHDHAELKSHTGSNLGVLVSHPTQWYRDLWMHRRSAEARSLGAIDEPDFLAFCEATSGAFTKGVERMLGAPAAQWPIVRAEFFNHDVRKALKKFGFEIPNEGGYFPAFREAHDEMAGRKIDESTRAAAGIVAAGDPMFAALGYRFDGETCGPTA